jgi:tetratricopeptide (TPR) repeat protein
MKKLLIPGALLSTLFCFSQNDKITLAFKRSIDQEKKYDYASAIQTMYDDTDTTTYEVIMRLGWLNYKSDHKKISEYYYKKAIDVMPNAIEPRYGYCFPAYLLENFNSVIEQDKKILEIDPNNKIINSNLAHIYYYNKQYDKALVYFKKIIELYPWDYENNLTMAWTYLRMKNELEAQKTFNTVLLYSPKDVSANDGLNNLKKNDSKDQKMLDAFSKSYELTEAKNYKGAIEALKPVYDKANYFVNVRLGWLHYIVGTQTDALNYYKIAAELLPKAIDPKLGIANVNAALGNKNDQRAQYDAVLLLDPHNTYVHYQLGLMDYYKKDYTVALTHFEKIVSLYPCDADGILMIGWTHFQMGKVPESKPFFNRVLWESPDNASALQGLNSTPPKPAEPLKVRKS